MSLASTAPLEQGLVDKLHPNQPAVAMTGSAPTMQPQPATPTEPVKDTPAVAMTGPAPPAAPQPSAPSAASSLEVEGQLPSLAGAVQWLNSPPLTPEALEGKIVVVDFWTYSCINCLRAIPYVRAWYERNMYWPADYFIDGQGRIRDHAFGEGDYRAPSTRSSSCCKRPARRTWRAASSP